MKVDPVSAQSRAPALSLVVPLYNEQDNATWVVESLARHLDAGGDSYELILVDNGSTDGTAEILKRSAPQHASVRVVSVGVNEGYGRGIIQGLCQARGEYIGYMSGDGQIQPEDPLRVYKALRRSGAPAGKIRRVVRHDGWLRLVNSFCYNGICALGFGLRSRDINGTPKIIARDLLDQLELSSGDWFIDFELMLKLQWLGAPVLEVPTEYLARRGGSSKVRLRDAWEFVRNMASVRWGGRFGTWQAAHERGAAAWVVASEEVSV